jgi:hypothetical protein
MVDVYRRDEGILVSDQKFLSFVVFTTQSVSHVI